MKKLLNYLLLTVIISAMLLFAASAADNVIFLKDGGTGDGSSASSAVGTLDAALARINTKAEATVVICGPFTQSADYVPQRTYTKVTYTSVYGGVDYRESAGANWQFNGVRFACRGETVFENIDFVSKGSFYRIAGQHKPVTLGEGITVTGENLTGTTIAKSFAILGGFEKDFANVSMSSVASTNVTVLSGEYLYIVPFAYNVNGSYKGTANINIGGTADVRTLLCCSAYPSGVTVGNVRVTLTGSPVLRTVYKAVHNATINSIEFIWDSYTPSIGSFHKILTSTSDSTVVTVNNPTVLRVSDKAAATMYYERIIPAFDRVISSANVPADVALNAPSDEELAAITRRGEVYGAFTFDEVSENNTEISVRIPAEASGNVYRVDGDYLVELNSDIVADGLLTFDVDSAGTYICADDSYLIAGDINMDNAVNVLDVACYIKLFLGSDNAKYDVAAAEFDGDRDYSVIKILRFMKSIVESEKAAETDFNPDDYNVISVTRYLDKTKLGFLSQIVGFLSGYEFARDPATNLPMIAMADSYFELCNGAYADHKDINPHSDKHLYNEETGIWEVWNDDDFSIDIFNQYMLRDMYAKYGTINSKVITDSWVAYDIYDMGGGNRDVGAYGQMKRYQYLPIFAGITEVGNNFNVSGEPYIANETLGMVTPGMPDLAVDLAYKFGSATSDRDPVEWLKMFAAMYSMAYFENDIPTLIRTAQAAVFAEGSWEDHVVDECFKLYAKYPSDWRKAVVEADQIFRSYNYDVNGYMGCTSINCSFIILGLLYGDGDYYNTCKIISLAGHGGDSTTPTALGVVGVVCGWSHIDTDTQNVINQKVWQDGNGVIVNRPLDPNGSTGTWMHAAGLEERFNIKELVYLYQENFEKILYENGGFKLDNNYYIPKQTITNINDVYAEHFESNGIADYKVSGGTIGNPSDPFMGSYALELTSKGSGESVAYTTVSGLTVGETYKLTAQIRTGDGVTAHMFVRESGKDISDYVTVHDSNVYVTRYVAVTETDEVTGETVTTYPESDMCSYVKRELAFTATAETMEIGLMLPATTANGGSAAIDAMTLAQVDEISVADVTVSGVTNENGAYDGQIRFDFDGGSEKEVWLKLTYSSHAAKRIEAITRLNRAFHSRTPLFPTNGGKITIYIPILANKDGDNILTMFVNDSNVTVYEAKLIK